MLRWSRPVARGTRADRGTGRPAEPAEEKGDDVIYICVPAHDEGQTVGVVLWKVRQVMAEADRDYQILVADDGSTDKTAAVLEPYTRVMPLTVMRTEDRRGYGASLEMLLREAVHRSEYPRRDAVVVLQADFTEDPEHIAALLKRVESGADVVVSHVVGAAKPTLKRRLTAALERLLLRRRGVPDQATDPLEGFHAYRVSAVRRAFEQDTHARLLPWHGRLANAALLTAVVPHARRVDAVDWLPRPERRQRPTRSDAGTRLREIWEYSRNRTPTDVIPVAGLAPSSVRTARTSEHEVTSAALRAAGVTRPGEEERPRRRRTGAGSRNGKAGPGVKDGRRSRRSTSEAAEAPKRERPSADGTRKRRRRKPRPEVEASEAVAADSAVDSPVDTPEPESEAAEPRKRRSRRGRRRTTGPETAGDEASVETPAGEDPATDAAGGEGDTESPDGGEKRSRRRRGRRGGRRRSGRSREGGEAAQDPGSEGTAPSAPDASGEGERIE